MNGRNLGSVLVFLCAFCVSSPAQTTETPTPTPTITLTAAIARARQYGGQIQGANLAVLLAKEDSAQVRAGRLPTLNAFNQFIYTEGNGTPSGVYVANDGVHVYNEQAQVHEELLSVFRRAEIRRALASQAVATARVEIAARGINATVIQDYYAIISAQRRFVNAQTSLREANQFLDITEKLEKGGEAAHADVIKAQILQRQRERDIQDSQIAIEKAKISLGVLIFPNFTADFTVGDDLGSLELLPPSEEARAKAVATSPDIKAAKYSLQAAGYDVGVARYSYLPSLGLDFFYGIDANQFAANSAEAQSSGRSTQPNYEVMNRQNLGYSGQITLNVPVWNWGATRSKVRQAEFKESQAKLDLSLAERTLQANLTAAYAEARAALAQLDSLRGSADLSAESLRLTLLRYEAGEASALEVADAQATVSLARNAYDDGQVRYRVALANLRTLTGSF